MSKTDQPPLPQLPLNDSIFENGRLVSRAFDDIYFSTQGGLKETEHVFIHGTELPDCLAGHDDIVIAETGFGTGLNLCAVMSWMKKTKTSAKVTYISFEASPLSREIAAQALAAFPELEPFSQDLIMLWPPRWPGVHHFSVLDGQLEVTLHYGQAEDLLPQLDFKADFWFLDGFSPSKNTSIWSQQVLENVARCSYKGTKLASFTVARAVRTCLAEAGFAVERRPGFGHKRHMLTATMSKGREKPCIALPEHVLIIGGGVAGCAIAFHLRRLGISHQLIDSAPSLASHASGNPAGLVLPHLSVGDNLPSRLSLSAFADALKNCTAANAVFSQNILSLDIPDVKKIRQQKLATQDYPQDLACYMEKTDIAEQLGFEANEGGMLFPHGLVIDPKQYCQYLAADSDIIASQKVTQIQPIHPVGWRVATTAGKIFEASHLILCTGYGLPEMCEQLDLSGANFQLTSGQLSFMDPAQMSKALPALNFGGYLARFGDKVMLGASYSHHLNAAPSEEGHKFNLDLLPPTYHHLIDTDIKHWQGRVSQRLATKHRMPICDENITQQHHQIGVLGALGSRGLTYASYLARHLTNQLAGRPSFLSRKLSDKMRLEHALGIDF